MVGRSGDAVLLLSVMPRRKARGKRAMQRMRGSRLCSGCFPWTILTWLGVRSSDECVVVEKNRRVNVVGNFEVALVDPSISHSCLGHQRRILAVGLSNASIYERKA